MKKLPLIALTLVSLLSIAACSDNTTAPDTTAADKASRALPPSNQTIAEIADAQGFTLLLAAVGYIAETNPSSAIVADILDNTQSTVFAPTDQAFLNLVGAVTPLLDPTILAEQGPFAAIDALLGAGTIEAVVSYHVVEGRRAANSVVPKKGVRTIETMLEGATFGVTPAGMIQAVGNTAGIVAANVSASNGVIHVIDAVILPVDLGL
jgi:transforming growth factor-beta-induced protein